MKLSGTYTALVTPFTADGTAVDFDALERLARDQAAGGVTGVVPCGTTGEAPTLSTTEHRLVIERTVATARTLGLEVIAGAGANDTRHAIALHQSAAAAGADATLQVVPYYNRPSQRGLARHFLAIADSADLPVVLYNVPSRTGRRMEIDTIITLAGHPNIVAIKDATGCLDLASATVGRTSLALLCGDDTLTLPMAAVGGTGVISVLSNLMPARVSALCRAFLDGDWNRARTLHHDLFDLASALLSLDSNPVPIKAALSLDGRLEPTVRPPLATADADLLDTVRRLIVRPPAIVTTRIEPKIALTAAH